MSEQTKKKSGPGWQKSVITTIKKTIKAKLDSISHPRERLAWLLEQIRENNTNTPESQIKHFVCVLSCLIQHTRHQTLNSSQVKRLSEMGNAILQIQGIKPGRSRLSFLHSELHTVLSQVHRMEGKLWESMWEQQMATVLAKAKSEQTEAYQSFSAGIRSLRLGHTEFSLNCLERALHKGLSKRAQIRAKLELVRIHRLRRDFEGAKAETREILKLELTEPERLELRWEEMLLCFYRTGDLYPLIKSVGRNQPHNHYAYVYEVFFMTRALPSTQWIQQFSKARYLAKNTTLDRSSTKSTQPFTEAFENCYDYDIPFATRLSCLGGLVSKTSQLVSLELELLFWVGTINWLYRSKAYGLATLLLEEYRTMSRRITGGKLDDTLGLVGDLKNRSWYSENLEKTKKVA